MAATSFSYAEEQSDGENLFHRHLKEARSWLSEQENVQLSRSHYSPKFRENLSILRDNGKTIAVDYYWTFSRKFSGENQEGNYLFKERDILIRYTISDRSFRLIYF